MRTFAEIKKSINTLMAKGAKWQDEVQAVAVEALNHSVTHRECSLLNMIFDQFPSGAKQSSFKAWLESEELFTVNKNNKISVRFVKETLDTAGADSVELMTAVKWYECKAPAKEPVYSTEQLVKKLKAVVNFAKEGEEHGVAWGSTMLNLIHAIEQQIPAE